MALTYGAGPHQAFINGFPIENGSVEQHAVKKSSTFSATLPLNYPGAIAAFSNPTGGPAVISVTTRGLSGNLLTGVIDAVDFDYIGTRIHVSGRDVSANLHENLDSSKYINQKGSQIVQTLCGKAGIPVQASASCALMAGKKLNQDYVKMTDNITFAQVIHKLAEFDAANWFVDPNGTLHYVDLGSHTGVYTLNYNAGPPIVSDCLALSINLNVKAAGGQAVTVKSWHPKDKQVHQNTATGGGGAMIYNFHIPTFQMDHVQQFANAKVKELARHGVKLKATIVGDPTISAGMGVQLNGTGTFDQIFDMDSVHHRIGMSGHTTMITARSALGGGD
jgi:hypothetical protein